MLKNEQKLKYVNLWNHRNERSTIGLAFSEFIDNSIAAYLRAYEKHINGCTIIFTIDESDENNHRLLIRDNASGMDEETLNKAVEQYKNAGYLDDSGLNQYGLGMKFGIFYLGKTAKIWTKENGCDEYIVDYEAENKKPDDVVTTIINISTASKIPKSGTLIEIDYVYNDRKFVKKSQDAGGYVLLEDIEKWIAMRYKKYIDEGLIIRFIHKNYKNEEIEILNLTRDYKFEDDIETLSFKLSTFLKDINRIPDRDFAAFKTKCQDYLRGIQKNIEKSKPEFYELFIDIIDKMISNETIIQKEMINFNGEELPVTLTIMNAAKLNKAGVAILHKNRYIRHLPNRNIDNIKFGLQPFSSTDRFAEGKFKWLYAEVNLTDSKKYKIKPDKNKYDFLWTTESIASWDAGFESLVRKYLYLLNNVFIQLQEYASSLKSNEINKKTNSEAKNSNKPYFPIDSSDATIYDFSKEPGGLGYFKIEEAVKFKIECDEDLKIAFDFEEIDSSEDEKVYRFIYNPTFEKNIKEMKSPKLAMIRALCILYYILELSGRTYDNILDIFKKISSESNEV